MKLFKLSLLFLAALLFGCQQAELDDFSDSGAVKMKTVTLSAEMGIAGTKASLNSYTGAFTWQSGDLISVLATDNKFYDFILTGEHGKGIAEFSGSIPENENVTTVATYPRIVADGSENIVLSSENILSYNLPDTWTYAKDVSNVPMVAGFEPGADYMSFKQVGGVMRFPVKNLPLEAQFVVTMNDKTITGQFPVDITKLGEDAMVAGTEPSVLTINYSSDVDGGYAEFNVPVPTGTYNNFKVEVKDAQGNVLLMKDYEADNTVNRATLLNMQELVLPERPMVISEVWPFFVDARVVFDKHEGITEYAFYIDGADTPKILTAEDVYGGKIGALVGGEFSHNSTHTVAVAKAVNSTPVAESKSEAVEFKTADMRQLTTNTGTKFVTVGWDDVAIGWGPKWDDETKRWSAVPKTAMPDDGAGLKVHQRRGYQVQLLAADKTVIYDMITFDGHAGFTGTFSDSSWLGKKDGENLLIPTALAFGYLEPGTDYYFRVKTLDEPVEFDDANGNYNDGSADQPNPYILRSDRGGCAWSNLIKLSTDPVHVPSENEIFHEGFDDIMLHSDYVNWAPAVVPDLGTVPQSWDDYVANNTTTGYPEFLTKPANERKWTTEAFSEQVRADAWGLYDNPYVPNTKNVLNGNAGSLKGWSVYSTKDTRNMYPIFGAVRLGQSGSNKNGAILYTPPINSTRLYNDVGTHSTVKLKIAVCATSGDKVPVDNLVKKIKVGHQRNEGTIKIETYSLDEVAPSDWISNTSDGVWYQQYYDVVFETYLRNNDVLFFDKTADYANSLGMIVIGDVKIEITPGKYEGDIINPEDTGVGTEPNDNVNYDVFGLNEFPITYYFGPPSSWYQKTDEITGAKYYDQDLTKATYQEIKDAGFNIATYIGVVDYSLMEQKRILEVCNDVGLKFISSMGGGGLVADPDAAVAQVKEHFYPNPAYLGDFGRDEPNASEFTAMGEYVTKFLAEMPEKEVYHNLFPIYANNTQLGSASYEEHVDDYLAKVPTKSVSYDFYGLKNGDIDKRYYQNLDLVRKKSLDARKPFWVITQAGAIGSSTIDPNEEQQRWSVWSNIALGSKGISYFTYWTPPADANDTFHSGFIVKEDGTKRPIYNWVKQINSDIKTIGQKLLYCHADGAILSRISFHYLWTNGALGRTMYGPIQKVGSGLNNYQVLCGCFRDARTSENGENFKGYKALVMSQIHSRDIVGELTLDPVITKVTITHNNTSQEVDLVSNMEEVSVGDIKVSFVNGVMSLAIPSGEAALVEF